MRHFEQTRDVKRSKLNAKKCGTLQDYQAKGAVAASKNEYITISVKSSPHQGVKREEESIAIATDPSTPTHQSINTLDQIPLALPPPNPEDNLLVCNHASDPTESHTQITTLSQVLPTPSSSSDPSIYARASLEMYYAILFRRRMLIDRTHQSLQAWIPVLHKWLNVHNDEDNFRNGVKAQMSAPNRVANFRVVDGCGMIPTSFPLHNAELA